MKNTKLQAQNGTVASQTPSVNFHLWKACNFRCKFCFATFEDIAQSFLPKGHLPKEQALQVVSELAAAGFQKITFAGGEPTLCSWLPDLIARAKALGMTTMIVTNGSRLSPDYLDRIAPHLDWIALSIDSLDAGTNAAAGRTSARGDALSASEAAAICEAIRDRGIRLKINTVVHRHNQLEDMSAFLRLARPERWKVLQVMQVEGQNDAHFEDLRISTAAFQAFVARHRGQCPGIEIVPEEEEMIRGSYVMVDPAGRFFDSASGQHRYSEPILQVGVDRALAAVSFDLAKFRERGGVYEWAAPAKATSRIVICGDSPALASEVGRCLAERLRLEFKCQKALVAERAAAFGQSPDTFQQYLLKRPGEALDLDLHLCRWAQESEAYVLCHPLGAQQLPEAFSILLLDGSENGKVPEGQGKYPLETEGGWGAIEILGKGKAALRREYLDCYDFDYLDEANYDLVLRVANGDAMGTVERIYAQIA